MTAWLRVSLAAVLLTSGSVFFVIAIDFPQLVAGAASAAPLAEAGFAALLGANDKRPCFPNVGTKKATATSIG